MTIGSLSWTLTRFISQLSGWRAGHIGGGLGIGKWEDVAASVKLSFPPWLPFPPAKSIFRHLHSFHCTLTWTKMPSGKLPHCTMSILSSMFSFQPNKPRHILKFVSWYIIQHIFGRKIWISRKSWLSNSKFGISGSFWPILSVPKIMFLVPENEKRNKF